MIQIVTEKQDEICRDILNSLPEWFGIPAATERYAQDALKNTCIVYIQNETIFGIMGPRKPLFDDVTKSMKVKERA